ncbi:MAG: hypothetical protein ACK5QW_03095 [Cyanobacteriota bacterium]
MLETARLASAQLSRLADPEEGPRWREQLRQVAQERIGGAGGTDRMVEAIMAQLPCRSRAVHAHPLP